MFAASYRYIKSKLKFDLIIFISSVVLSAHHEVQRYGKRSAELSQASKTV